MADVVIIFLDSLGPSENCYSNVVSLARKFSLSFRNFLYNPPKKKKINDDRQLFKLSRQSRYPLPFFFPTPPPLTLASFHAVLNWVDSRAAYLSLSLSSAFVRHSGLQVIITMRPIKYVHLLLNEIILKGLCVIFVKGPFLFLFCFFFLPLDLNRIFGFGGALALACNYLVRWLGFIFMNVYGILFRAE